MYPMPDNTKVVLLVTKAGVVAQASNIDPNLEVVVTSDPGEFYLAALGMSFNSTRPAAAPWVAASKKS